VDAKPTPIPKATASPPTRPIKRADPMFEALSVAPRPGADNSGNVAG
jgi:hypothetical protein